MSEPWLVYLAIFAFSVLAAQQLQVGLGALLRDRARTRRRLDGLGGPAAAVETEILRRRAAAQAPWLAAWERLVLQSGSRGTSPARLVLWGAGPGLLALLFLPLPLPARLAAGGLVGGLTVYAVLRVRRARRLARFGEQLPEVIDVVVRSLRAGHPLPVSLALVARESAEPAGPEFALVVDEMSYGRSLSEALEGLRQRVGHPELAFLVAAIGIADQTGGNLGEILARLSKLLRERFRLRRRVRALTAEGRFSGLALSVLPVALFGAVQLVSPAYYAEFWQSASAPTVTGIALALLAIGNLAILRLVNFKV